MNTEDALFFIRVATHGSFSKAARSLNMPKSTLSRRIANLEADLGVKLLERTTRQLALTDLGQGYLYFCERIIEDVEEANNFLTQSQSTPNGTLKISISTDAALLHMQELFANFMLKYPDISLEVDLTHRVVNLVEEGVDVAIRAGAFKDSTLIARKIGIMNVGLYAGADFYLPEDIPTHPYQLDPDDCIGMNAGSKRMIFNDKKKKIEIIPQHRYKVNNLMMIQAAVLKNLGVAFLSKDVCRPYVKQKKLISILDQYIPEGGALFAVYPSKKYMPSKLRVFLEYLNENLN
jgi:DNA-binding transcriptional LysR family regulator